MKKSDLFTYNGETRTIEEWCDISGITYNGLSYRLKYGWTMEEALNTPTLQKTGRKDGRKPRADRNCVDCEYSMRLLLLNCGVWYACDYLGRTGKRRPCESGDKCTVKIKATKKRRPGFPFPL